MNGVHDMGGQHGLGPIAPEADEPVFHHDWERRVHALVLASPTRGNIDAGRHQRERIPGPEYLRMTYYEKWFTALEEMLLAAGAVTAAEIAAGRADPDSPRGTPRLPVGAVPAAMARQGSYLREGGAPAFAVGQKVRARNLHPTGHTRLPRYLRGRVGEIELSHGPHVFPDSHAHGKGEAPQPLYTVRFEAREIWGPDASATDTLSADLWESYLEPA